MHHRETAQNSPVTHMHMAGELGIVGKDRVIAHHAVMREMNVSHDPVIVAHAGDAGIAGRADVERAKLTDGVSITNHQLTGLTGILFVLRNSANRVELKNFVVTPYGGVTLDHAMRTDA